MKFTEAVNMQVRQITGKDVSKEDTTLLKYISLDVETHIKNFINYSCVPNGLSYVWVNLTTARYIEVKLSSNAWQDNELNVPKSIRLGDTTVELTGDDVKTRLMGAIEALRREDDMKCYRRLKW
jgi:hypothetical protein|nr:MAG TPA: tail connector protein [Caudoviricetes sp.]